MPLSTERMWYLLALAVCMSAAATPAAQAEDWPEHGYYRVQSEGEGAQRLCRFRAEVSVDGLPFAFILSQRGERPFLAQVMAQDARMLEAAQVAVGFDRQSVFLFTPTERDPSPEITSVTGELTQGDVIEQLRRAATGAQWFQVAALPYWQSVPAEGMAAALEDMAICRKARRT